MREERFRDRCSDAGGAGAPGAFAEGLERRGEGGSPDGGGLRGGGELPGGRWRATDPLLLRAKRDGTPASSPRQRLTRGVTPEVIPDVTPGFPLDEALHRVRGDERTQAREGELPWHEVFERQEQRLTQQARELGLPTDWKPPAEARAGPGGAEHYLWLAPDRRVYKMTKEDHFGQVPCYNPDSVVGWENFAGAPSDYLERLILMNRVFGGDLRVEGLRCGRTVAIVTSQPLARAAHPRHRHPRDMRKIEVFMEARGFVNLGFAAWFHPLEKLMVTDATPDNFIATRKGLVPVDLMICRAEGDLLRVLEAKVTSGQPNDEVRLRVKLQLK